MKVKHWKDWWLVVDDKGMTIEQFKSKKQADDFKALNKDSRNPCLQRVSQRFGQTIRHISVYPCAY